ncbi:hypothetical protein ACMFMG_011452 [Clarireedia jacksonii]
MESTLPQSSPLLNEPSQSESIALPHLSPKDDISPQLPPLSLPPLTSPPLPKDPTPNPPSNTNRSTIYGTSTNACLLAHQHEDLTPSDAELEHLIHLYRTELTPRFPFVVLELRNGMTGKEWMAENPLLGKAVLMAASYYNLPRQTRLDREIVRELSESILIRGEKTLEGLQTILVFCAWYQYHCLCHPQLNNLLSLAVGMITHLQLNKPPTSDRFRYPFGNSKATSPDMMKRSMHHRRALAGCFYLTSMVSTGFQRIDAMKYPVYLDECCRIIAEEKEYPTDVLLLELVKITDLAERIVHTAYVAQRENEMSVPTALQLGAYTAELKTLKKLVPEDLKDNIILQMHHDTASMRLYEIALSPTFQPPTSSFPSTLPLFPSHLSALHTLLQHVSHFTTLTLALPSSIYLSLPLTPCCLLAYVLMILARLSFYTHPALPSWDLEFVRGVCDLSWVLGTVADRDEGAKFVGGVDEEEGKESKILGWNGKIKGWTDRLDKFAAKVRRVRGWYDGRVVKAGWSVERGSGRLSERERNREKGNDIGAGNDDKEKDPEIGAYNGNAREQGISTNGGILNGSEHLVAENATTMMTEQDITTSAATAPQDNVLGDLDMYIWPGLDEQTSWMEWCGDWDAEMSWGGGSL